MGKESIVVGALLLALALTAFLMAWLQHDELLNRDIVEALAAPPPPIPVKADLTR